MRDNVHYLHRQHRPNLFDQGEARNEAPIEPWNWRAAFWGAVLGCFVGMMATAGLAYIWSFFL